MPATDARGDVDPAFTARAQQLALQSAVPSVPGHTYLLRAIPHREHDVLVAFCSVSDDDDGHTLVWRVLRKFGTLAEPRLLAVPAEVAQAHVRGRARARLDPRLSGAQQLVYSTFLGGSDAEEAKAISVDAAGVVTVAGSTASTDLPTTLGAWDGTYNGAWDAFLTRLDPRMSGGQTSNAVGASTFGLPLLANPALVNLQAHAQLAWFGPTSPPPCPPPGFSASNAIELTVEP